MINYFFSLIIDHWIFILLSIPFLFIKALNQTRKIFFYLYKNNRSGINNGFSKHFADRLLEVYYLKDSAQYGISYKFSKEYIMLGSATSSTSLDTIATDDYLIGNGLVIKGLDKKLKISRKTLESRIKNTILINVFKFISKYVYLDKNLF